MDNSKIPDNFNKDFPARMADGRFITDYSSSCQHNLFYQQGMNSWQYRMFLTTNGIKIINDELAFDEEEFGCSDCSKDFVPEVRFEQDCSNDNCLINEVNPAGIGIQQKKIEEYKVDGLPTMPEVGSLLQ
tara:strand:- start:963 stop:1352 length:390 start_codon:yes stop_codon:yes gene_type:complete